MVELNLTKLQRLLPLGGGRNPLCAQIFGHELNNETERQRRSVGGLSPTKNTR